MRNGGRRLAVALVTGATAFGAVGTTMAHGATRADAVAAFAQQQADRLVPAGWTGDTASCTVGTESPASLAATQRTVNAIRGLAGVAPVSFDPARNAKALAAALMMRAAGSLTHDPNPSWPCWSAGGDEAARKSDLYLGRSGADAVVGWLADTGIATLGHRRWLLDQTATVMGSGSTGTSAALYVIGGQGAPVPGRVRSWPPAGAVPWPWVFDDWTLNIDGDPSEIDVSAAKVAVSIGGQPLTVTGLQALAPGQGSGVTLRFRVALPDAVRSGDAQLSVSATGVTVDGKPAPISYTVASALPPGSNGLPDAVAIPGSGVNGGGAGAGGGGTASGGGSGAGAGSGASGAAGAGSGAAPAGTKRGGFATARFSSRPSIGRDTKRARLRAGSRVTVGYGVRNFVKVTFQWKRDGRAIRGATKRVYRVRAADRGHRISATVTAVGGDGRKVRATSPARRVAR